MGAHCVKAKSSLSDPSDSEDAHHFRAASQPLAGRRAAAAEWRHSSGEHHPQRSQERRRTGEYDVRNLVRSPTTGSTGSRALGRTDTNVSRGSTTVGRAHFITHRYDSALQQEYEVGDKKGEGTQGVVFKATRKSDSVVRAVKQVAKASMKGADMQAFMKEMNIMRGMDHPNIVKLYETFEDRRNTYLVMELCSGGELLDRILAQGFFTEPQAAVVIQQVLRAVFYMHGMDIVHRDLKPENFLLAQDGPIAEDNLLKLIDFGIACECRPNQFLTELRGTPYYAAPQVVTRRYDRKCDIWSAGVIMFVLLTGSVPFGGSSDEDIMQKVRIGIVKYDNKHWADISEEAKSLVKALLTRNAQSRPSAEVALKHEWIRDRAPRAKARLPRNFTRKLTAFKNNNTVKKVALQIVAGELDDAMISQLRRVFMSLDGNGDGLLTCSEMRDGFLKARMQIPPNLQEMLDSVDADGSGVIDYTEFIAAMLDRRRHLSEGALRQAFDKFDRDGDGRIQAKEIMQVLSRGSTQQRELAVEAEGIIHRYDTDGDGGLTFGEFLRMMTSGVGGHDSSEPASEEGTDEEDDDDDESGESSEELRRVNLAC